jgi:hypothetical protein
MTERVCKTCDRPLIKEDGKYCPNCNAKRVGKVGKAGGIISTLGAAALIVGGFLLKIFNKK